MTEALSMALGAQQYSVVVPSVTSEPASPIPPGVQSYQPPLPPSGALDLKPLLDHMGKVSEGIKSALKPVGSPQDEREKESEYERFPELRKVDEVYAKLREFSMVELQFTLIGKSLQIADRNVQALYQQQG